MIKKNVNKKITQAFWTLVTHIFGDKSIGQSTAINIIDQSEWSHSCACRCMVGKSSYFWQQNNNISTTELEHLWIMNFLLDQDLDGVMTIGDEGASWSWGRWGSSCVAHDHKDLYPMVKITYQTKLTYLFSNIQYKRAAIYVYLGLGLIMKLDSIYLQDVNSVLHFITINFVYN